MATAADKFTWDAHKVAVREYVGLGASTSEDTNLQLWLEAAALDLDTLAGWYYTDKDGEQVDETPPDPSADPLLKLGVYEWIKAFRSAYSSPVTGGALSVKTGALQEVYQGGQTGLAAQRLARQAAQPLWTQAIHQLLRAPQAV